MAWSYWLAVVMVGIFGTMAADVLHVGFHVPYVASALLYAVVLAAVFVTWQRTEGTLSVHTIDTARRELFYWAAVVSTFALGTAVGDLTAITLSLGYFGSAILYAAVIGAIAVARVRFGLNPIVAFWAAYVVTRPLGASVADWLAKAPSAGGLGFGGGPVSLVLASAIASSSPTSRSPASTSSRPVPNRRTVEAWDRPTEACESLLGIVLRQHLRIRGPPRAPDADPHGRVRREVAHVARVAPVLGHDPPRRALEVHPHHRASPLCPSAVRWSR